MIYSLNTEYTIKTIIEGLLNDKTIRENNAVYIGLDMRINTDSNNFEQRSVAVAVHLLYFYGSIYMATDENFLFMKFNPECKWKFVSSHDSCWADSMMHDIGDIVRDVMTNMGKSEYTIRYGDDDLTYSDKYSVNLSMSGIRLVNKSELEDAHYSKDGTQIRPMIHKWMKA